MSERLTTVIIVTYNSRNVLPGTLEIVRQGYEAGLLRCIVVDNASSDGTADYIGAEQPWIELVQSPSNLGYARGLNLGLQYVQTPYVLFSNPDACLHPRDLATLVSFLETHPDAGMAAPALLGPNHGVPVAGGLPTPWGDVARAAGFPGWLRKRRPVLPGSATRTDWLCGALILTRKDLMDRLGGLDPRFFLYFEETDLCRRVLDSGMSLWAVGEATGYHEQQSTVNQMNAVLFSRCIAEHFFRSRFYYFVKHHGWIPAICGELGELFLLLALAVPRRIKSGNWGQLGVRLGAPILRLPPRPLGAAVASRAGTTGAGETGRVGIVVIGRNEGERLGRCLESVVGRGAPVVYVDSGSEDGSIDLAQASGAVVLSLDGSKPYTAARGRNEGFERLLQLDHGVEFVQFVDGDCEIADGWMEQAKAFLSARADVAMVCGRLRERAPSASIYNRLCELEWRRKPGETDACGGIAMARVPAFRQVAGFDASLIAGEEAELCLRLRRNGWHIWGLDAEMGRHDAAMTGFRQWWSRTCRIGRACAAGMWLNGRGLLGYHRRTVGSAFAWGLVGPGVMLVLLTAAFWRHSLLAGDGIIVSAYVLLALRIARARRCLGDSRRDAALYVPFCLLGKVPQSLGALSFWANQLLGRTPRPIEYKRAPHCGH